MFLNIVRKFGQLLNRERGYGYDDGGNVEQVHKFAEIFYFSKDLIRFIVYLYQLADLIIRVVKESDHLVTQMNF